MTRSALLVMNRIDLASAIGAALAVIRRDTKRMRDTRPFVGTNLKSGAGGPGNDRLARMGCFIRFPNMRWYKGQRQREML